jgi:EAL domain-containing protein (putative c-di-GMP-specific phosphodiesterase class I)
MPVAVNVSMVSLSDVSMADQILEVVRAEGGSPQEIVLEITETAAAADLGRELENLTRMRIAGFGLAIDDYGAGYASMQQLTRIPFTELKVDSSFVTAAASRNAARVVLESSLSVARQLHLNSVAEGVESESDMALLRSMECNAAQGFFIARPMDLDAFLRWCRNRHAIDPTNGTNASV